MKLICYVSDCHNSLDIPFLTWIWLCIRLWDRKFYVCSDHHDLFKEEDTYDVVRGYRIEVKDKYKSL